MLFSFSKIKNLVTFTCYFPRSCIEILDKLDRYSHLSINKNSLLFIYSFIDFIDAKFREAYLPFAFIRLYFSLGIYRFRCCFRFPKLKILLLLLNLLFSSVEILDKLDRYSHLSINSLLFIYSLEFVDFIDAKFREAYLPFTFIRSYLSFEIYRFRCCFRFPKLKILLLLLNLLFSTFECRDLG